MEVFEKLCACELLWRWEAKMFSVSAFLSTHRILICQKGLKLREAAGTPELVVAVKNQKKVKSQLQMV